jgi:hypothetical protein
MYPVCKTSNQFMLGASANYAMFFLLGIHYQFFCPDSQLILDRVRIKM